MGAHAQIGARDLLNLKHTLFKNLSHHSVDGKPTAGATVDFAAFAKLDAYNLKVLYFNSIILLHFENPPCPLD